MLRIELNLNYRIDFKGDKKSMFDTCELFEKKIKGLRTDGKHRINYSNVFPYINGGEMGIIVKMGVTLGPAQAAKFFIRNHLGCKKKYKAYLDIIDF
ncbi:MAG: hypothetical protein MUD12_02865 [Spirochaetes bacterium]|jgi:hypothetical protein|nr:hypothetical protein [Spirochaetota bacterium]